MDWILIGTGCRYSITTLVQVLIRFLEYRRQVPKAAEHTSITTRNRSLVFNNNTSASFDTFFRIQEMGSESCIKYFDYYPGTVHWYSITTLVQVLIRFSNTGYGFLYLQNILRLLPRNHSLVFCNNFSFRTIDNHILHILSSESGFRNVFCLKSFVILNMFLLIAN